MAASSSQSSLPARGYEDELAFLKQETPYRWRIDLGFVPQMRVPGHVYVNEALQPLLWSELRQFAGSSSTSGFLPALKQIANVAALPGIVGHSIGLPDAHSGYGFAIGNVAAFDMDDPDAVVSPGGVGFDINCGVRLLRTNLTEAAVSDRREALAQSLFDHIPVGVGSQGVIPSSSDSLQRALELGMDWSVREGYAWAEDKEHCEESGRMLTASPASVSARAKKRGVRPLLDRDTRGPSKSPRRPVPDARSPPLAGLPQLGTLGAGNHYAEIQVVDRIFDKRAAAQMGLDFEGQESGGPAPVSPRRRLPRSRAAQAPRCASSSTLARADWGTRLDANRTPNPNPNPGAPGGTRPLQRSRQCGEGRSHAVPSQAHRTTHHDHTRVTRNHGDATRESTRKTTLRTRRVLSPEGHFSRHSPSRVRDAWPWPPGGDGRAAPDGAGDGARRHPSQRPAARVRADRVRRG